MDLQKANKFGQQQPMHPQSIINDQNISHRVPKEIWKKIFVYHEKLIQEYNFFPQNQNKLGFGRLRLVCKLWRDVIDEHVNFSFWLRNSTMENINMSHVRVYECKVTYFTLQPLPKKLPFRDQHILTKIEFQGRTSPTNFLWLLDQSPNLESVSMTGFFLNYADVFQVHNNEENAIIKSFWGRIKRLHLDIDCKANISDSTLKNMKQIMTTSMAKLEDFKLYVNSTAEIHDMVVKFLLINPSVKKMEFYCLNTSTSSSTPAHDFQLVKKEDYEKIQLESICLSLHNSIDFGRQTWMSIISAQRSLVNLKITPAGTSECLPRCLRFDDFGDMLPLNFSTLKYLKLGHLHYSAPIDARIFNRMTTLKFIYLHRTLNVEFDYYKAPGGYMRDYTKPPGIINLESLPASLEILELCDVKCEADDLCRMANADHLKNLKALELRYIGDSAVTPELVDSLVSKTSLCTVYLNPVGKSRRNFKTERKSIYDYVKTSSGIMIPDHMGETIKWCKVGVVVVPYKCLGY